MAFKVRRRGPASQRQVAAGQTALSFFCGIKTLYGGGNCMMLPCYGQSSLRLDRGSSPTVREGAGRRDNALLNGRATAP
jgi:hypothetical protein